MSEEIELFAVSPDNSVAMLSGRSMSKEDQLQDLIEGNLDTLLGIRFLKREFTISRHRPDTLGLDKDGHPVIIEYKRQKHDSITTQVMSYRHWVKTNKAMFENLIFQTFEGDRVTDARKVVNSVNWDAPRLLCVAAEFSKFTPGAVQEMGSHNIEIIRYRMFQHNSLEMLALLLPKETIAKRAPDGSPKPAGPSGGNKYGAVIANASSGQKNRLAALESFIKSLDGDVHGYQTKNYIAFKVNQAFASIRLRNSLDVILLDLHHLNPGEINPIRDIAEARGKVVRISIRYRRDVNRIKPFIRKSYRGSIAKHSGASQVNNGGKRKVTNRVPSRRVSKFPLSRGVFTAKYKGRTYEARELEDGAVEFNGKRYNSFTAVAKEITGYKVINGRDFFGVKKGGAKKATSRASHRLDPRLPPVGTTITRKYNGRIYEVKVLKSGFKLSGKRYQTLSAVAKKITGHRAVSGFHFFKLNK